MIILYDKVDLRTLMNTRFHKIVSMDRVDVRRTVNQVQNFLIGKVLLEIFEHFSRLALYAAG